MKNYFKINFDKLAVFLLPTFLQIKEVFAFLQVILSPLKWVYNQFMQFREANIYHINITPQVCYIEKVLNDRFDKAQRRIYISSGVRYDETFIFLNAEQADEYIYQENENKDLHIFNRFEVGPESADFFVFVPIELQPYETDIRAITETYKLASKTYNINWL